MSDGHKQDKIDDGEHDKMSDSGQRRSRKLAVIDKIVVNTTLSNSGEQDKMSDNDEQNKISNGSNEDKMPEGGQRRSRKLAVIDKAVDVNENDDDREREELRRENAAKAAAEGRVLFGDKALDEHRKMCIQFAYENKITSKNAHEFKLIEYMDECVQNADPVFASHALFASTKIYGCKVDNLYETGVRLSSDLTNALHKGPRKDVDVDKEEEEEGEVNAVVTKKRKIVKKSMIATSLDQINRKGRSEDIPQTNLRPDRYITESAIFDPRTLGLHLRMADNFWDHDEVEEKVICPSTCPTVLPEFPADRPICPTFDYFTFGDTSVPEISLEDQISYRCDYNTTSNEPVYSADVDSDSDEIVVSDDELPDAALGVSGQMKTPSKVSVSKDVLRTEKLMKAIGNNNSNYTYFDVNKVFKTLGSRGAWIPPCVNKNKRSAAEAKPKQSKKEVTRLIDFEDMSYLEILKNIATDVKTTMMPPWGNDIEKEMKKYITIPNSQFNKRDFYRLFTCRQMYCFPVNDPEKINLKSPPMSENENESDNEHAFNYFDDSSYIQDVALSVDDAVIAPSVDDEDIASIADDSKTDHDKQLADMTFDGQSLLNIPNRVLYQFIAPATTENNIDIEECKRNMWLIIRSMWERGEQARISALIMQIISQASDQDVENLSPAIIFNVVLALINEHSLNIITDGDKTDDFIVTPFTEN